MGKRAITAITIGITTLLAVYFGHDSFHYIQNFLVDNGYGDHPYIKTVLDFLNERGSKSGSTVSKTGKASHVLLTPEQLKEFDGGPKSKGLYLAILGEIFDVQKGAQHYRPGGGYAFFSGRDATRAYISGDFSEGGLTDDVSDLDSATLGGLEDWLSFYKDEYKFTGYVVGRYYDSKGKPTPELLSIKEKLNEAKKNKYIEEKNREIFPPCNSEWSKEKGSKVWCSNKSVFPSFFSGGVERAWVGVPREMHVKGKDPRCVCVRNTGAPSSDPDGGKHQDVGDLNYPGLKEYPGCSPTSDTCAVSHP